MTPTDEQRYHDAALFALDAQSEDGHLPHIRLKAEEKAEELLCDGCDFYYQCGEDNDRCKKFNAALELFELGVDKAIEKANERLKLLISLFDDKKEFNAEKFCEEFKKGLKEEMGKK